MDILHAKITKKSILCNIVITFIVFQSLIERLCAVFRYFDEMLALVVLGYSISCCIYNGKLKKNKYYIMMFICIFLYGFIGTISSMLYQYQSFHLSFLGAVLSLKWFSLMFGGYFVAKNVLVEKDYHGIKSGIYINVIGMMLWKAFSIVGLCGNYAVYEWDICAKCVFFICFLFIDWENDKKDFIAIVASVFMLVLSGRAKGYAAAMLCVFVLYFVIIKEKRIKLGQLIIIGVTLIGVAWHKISFYYIVGMKGDFARYRLMRTAIDIANDYFPLGTGWSTYGSYFSVDDYSPVYYLYGIDKHRELGTMTKLYLNDNYWASVCAETGWIGMASIIAFLVVVFLLIQKNYGMERTQINCYAAGFTIVGYMAITTVEETAFAQPALVCLGLLMGIVLYKINRKNNPKKG